jgi:uncharacterized glyoxalase superfamily protein PhnB
MKPVSDSMRPLAQKDEVIHQAAASMSGSAPPAVAFCVFTYSRAMDPPRGARNENKLEGVTVPTRERTEGESDSPRGSGGVHELFAYLCVSSANEAIAFYSQAFGAREKFRLTEPGGRIGHAELDFGGGITVMLADEFPEFNFKSPQAAGSTSVMIHLHVDNADEMIAKAIQAGATLEREIQDQFYGERSGTIRDPFGHRWNIGHSIEEVTSEEMQRRYTEALNTSKR